MQFWKCGYLFLYLNGFKILLKFSVACNVACSDYGVDQYDSG
jgi:hypothetical protein